MLDLMGHAHVSIGGSKPSLSTNPHRSPRESNQSPRRRIRNSGHLNLATGDRGLKSPDKVRFSVSACPGDAQPRENAPQTQAFLRRPVVRQNDENAWLTRQSGQTGLRGCRHVYRENTGKFVQNRPWTWSHTAATRHKLPGKPGVLGPLPCRTEQGISRSRTRKPAPGLGL